jgi:hypothetical protein
MKALRTAVICALVAAGSAGAVTAAEATKAEAPKEAPPEATIPFVNIRESIRGWQADGLMGLWIEDIRKQWYYAKLLGPCNGLDFAVSLGFETKTMSSLDKFGTVIVPNYQRCPIMSLVKSDAPPKEEKKSKKPKSSDK